MIVLAALSGCGGQDPGGREGVTRLGDVRAEGGKVVLELKEGVALAADSPRT
ncbi:hypothetical protein [Nonomuraea sp. PA05]|uniref:hypothetical protein n=1 Tax=Nonomuraea sp. PA05 TaxID=2604466 RepID=UPI0016522263|nr:hypothetical protein [Nonomuraea sp. PA05]